MTLLGIYTFSSIPLLSYYTSITVHNIFLQLVSGGKGLPREVIPTIDCWKEMVAKHKDTRIINYSFFLCFNSRLTSVYRHSLTKLLTNVFFFLYTRLTSIPSVYRHFSLFLSTSFSSLVSQVICFHFLQ